MKRAVTAAALAAACSSGSSPPRPAPAPTAPVPAASPTDAGVVDAAPAAVVPADAPSPPPALASCLPRGDAAALERFDGTEARACWYPDDRPRQVDRACLWVAPDGSRRFAAGPDDPLTFPRVSVRTDDRGAEVCEAAGRCHTIYPDLPRDGHTVIRGAQLDGAGKRVALLIHGVDANSARVDIYDAVNGQEVASGRWAYDDVDDLGIHYRIGFLGPFLAWLEDPRQGSPTIALWRVKRDELSRAATVKGWFEHWGMIGPTTAVFAGDHPVVAFWDVAHGKELRRITIAGMPGESDVAYSSLVTRDGSLALLLVTEAAAWLAFVDVASGKQSVVALPACP
jgi:hypothetical protein